MKNEILDKKGFGIIGLIAALTMLGLVALIAISVYQKQQPGFDKNLPTVKDFNIRPFAYTDAKHGDSTRYMVYVNANSIKDQDQYKAKGGESELVAEITKATNSEIIVSVKVKGRKPTACPPNALCLPYDGIPDSAQFYIPEKILNHSNNFSTDLVINIDGNIKKYALIRKGYVISFLNKSAKAEPIKSLPYYPASVANTAVHRGNSTAECEEIGQAELITALKSKNIQLAAEKYPGIDQVRPKEDEVLIVNNQDYRRTDTVASIGSTGCNLEVDFLNLEPL